MGFTIAYYRFCNRKIIISKNPIIAYTFVLALTISFIIVSKLGNPGIYSFEWQILSILCLLMGINAIYQLSYELYKANLTLESVRAFVKLLTARNIITFLLALIGAITVIVPFIQLIIFLLTGKH